MQIDDKLRTYLMTAVNGLQENQVVFLLIKVITNYTCILFDVVKCAKSRGI